MMVPVSGMVIPNLRPWVSPPQRLTRHPIFRGVEGILLTAFPLIDDEPEERLSKALAALVAALASRSQPAG